MLLAILIISLLVYAWGLFSEYLSSQDDLADIEDTAEFNEQFANYDRDDVQGYELLTLINRVIDYNTRESSDAEAVGNDKYKPITIILNLGSESTREDNFTRDGTLRLFTGSGNLTYTQSNTVNQLQTVLDFKDDAERRYGGADSATRLAKSIGSIFVTGDQENAIKTFNAYSTNQEVSTASELNNEKETIYKYYEFVQFKRGIFSSDATQLKYDATTGRIYQMKFDFTGNLY